MKLSSSAMALLVAAWFVLPASAAAQPAAAPTVTTQAQPAAKPSDGIKVHGHWTIEVRNRDGSVASHNEFQNQCVQCGDGLVPLLARQASVLTWSVDLNTSAVPGVCADPSAQPSPCYLVEIGTPVDPGHENAQFPTLDLSAEAGGALVLRGNFTASLAGDVASVVSRLRLTTTLPLLFSARTLATPIPVAAGQQVYVTVSFTFS